MAALGVGKEGKTAGHKALCRRAAALGEGQGENAPGKLKRETVARCGLAALKASKVEQVQLQGWQRRT